MFWAACQLDVGCGDGVGGDAGEAVEEDALLGLVEAGVGFGLRVDEGELGGELLEDGDGGGLVVDEDTAFAGGEDLAAEDDVVAFGVDAVFFEDGFGAGGGLKNAGDDGFIGPVADNFDGGLATHEERKCIYQYGLTRAGFAGEEIEAGAERGNGVIDDGVIFSAQFDEHPGTFSCRIDLWLSALLQQLTRRLSKEQPQVLRLRSPRSGPDSF